MVAKVFDVETCTSYVVARVAAPHDKAGVLLTFVAFAAGELKFGAVGTANGAAVVKLLTADGALVPVELVALTLQ
jgi:hypothetical protein